jgi:Putative zinc-finger
MSAPSELPGAGRHLGELAELHALGALESLERAQVEAHIATCASCAHALSIAEATVAVLDDTFVPQLEPPERLRSRIAASAQAAVPLALRCVPQPNFYATAAALLLAAGIGGGALVEHSEEVRQAAHDSAVVATIATSHFNHVTFTAHESSAPISKVLYARDGAWFYVVIDSTTCNCHVIVRSASGDERDLGTPEVRGSTATFFTRDFPRPTLLKLVDASGRIISGATLPYPAQ